MKVSQLSAILISGIIISGCAGKTWYKPGVTDQQFRMEQSRCIMESEAGTPVYTPAPTSYTTNYSGNVYSGGSSGYYSGTSTTYNNGIDLSGFAIAMKKQQIFDNCMYSLGYSDSPSDTDPSSSGTAYLDAPRNALNTTPRTSSTKAIRPFKEDLPLTLYKEPTSASQEVFILSEVATLEVLAETDGMFKVKNSDGTVGWLGKSHVAVELNSLGDVKCITTSGTVFMAPADRCREIGREVSE